MADRQVQMPQALVRREAPRPGAAQAEYQSLRMLLILRGEDLWFHQYLQIPLIIGRRKSNLGISIATKEATALERVLLSFQNQLRNSRVDALVDNQVV